MMLFGFVLAYIGWVLLAGTMARHRAAWPVWAGRCGGFAALLASLAACVASSGWHIGPVLWCGMLSSTACLHLFRLMGRGGKGES